MKQISLAIVALVMLAGTVNAKPSITVMHTIELVGTTYAFTDFGMRLFPPDKSRWMIVGWGVVGCGGYRYMEEGNKHLRARKFAWDMAGMGLRFLVGELKAWKSDEYRSVELDAEMIPNGAIAKAKINF